MIGAALPAVLALLVAVRLTVAGDSLALGIGASDSSRGFAFEVFRRVVAQRPGSEVTNLALGGATAADVLRLEIPRIAATQPDVVLLEAGANDAVRRHAAGDFARAYHALVSAVVRAAPHAHVVLFNVPDIAVSPIFEASAKPPLHRLALAYNAAIASEGRRIHAPRDRLVRVFGARRPGRNALFQLGPISSVGRRPRRDRRSRLAGSARRITARVTRRARQIRANARSSPR